MSDLSSEYETEQIADTPKISAFFFSKTKPNMVEKSTPDVTKISTMKEEFLICIKDLSNSLTSSMKSMSDDLSQKFNDLAESNRFLEASFNDAKMEAMKLSRK